MSATQTQTQTQVKIQLSTKDPSISLPESTGPILINTDLRRYALSTLVNHLLETTQPVPLDFLINGSTFLRTSIGEYLSSAGLSAETILSAEYVRASLPPAHVASFPHEAWLSSVDALTPSSRAGQWDASVAGQHILTSSFDGSLRIWNASGETVASTAAVSARGAVLAAKAARWCSASQVVSAGYDRAVRVWHFSGTGLEPQAELHGHTRFVNALDVHGPTARVLSASDDGLVGLWTCDAEAAPALEPQAAADLLPAKRRRGDAKVPQRGPLALLKGHTAAVTAAQLAPHDRTVGYSASADRTVRTWDLATAAAVDSRTTSHPLLALAAMPARGLLAAGTAARHVVLVDPREGAARVAAMTLRGHRGWVSSLAADPANENRLLSGSFDGSCRVWDVRASSMGTEGVVGESVFDIRRGKDETKVFGVCWDPELGILSAGEDKQVHIDRFS